MGRTSVEEYPAINAVVSFTHSAGAGFEYSTGIAAVTGKRIVVTAATLSTTAAEICALASGTANAHITGYLQFAAAGSIVLPNNPDGWCRTGMGEALKVSSSAANTTTSWTFVYHLE